MILSAQSIRYRNQLMFKKHQKEMISPFKEQGKAFGMSYGLSSCGYDIRIAENLTMYPQAFMLASTFEHFYMFDDLVGRVCDKSSWARQGLTLQNTVIEPGWHGYLTLEITNHSQNVIELKIGQPIAQVLFELLDVPTDQPYQGKYQDQKSGPQPAILEK